MIVDCISDLHGFYPELKGGDLLILAGDYTARDTFSEFEQFYKWLIDQNYKRKIFIAGNHDNTLFKFAKAPVLNLPGIQYLYDNGTEFEGFKIWGSPWTKGFCGMNPNHKAFTLDSEEELKKKWALIPDDVDILITHSPPYGILDRINRNNHVGSKSLQMELFTRLKPKLLVCGHIHESYGKAHPGGIVEKVINASHINGVFDPVNPPIRLIL